MRYIILTALMFFDLATFGQQEKILVLASVNDTGHISIRRTEMGSLPDHPIEVNFVVYNVIWQNEKQGLLATLTVLPDKVTRRAEFEEVTNFTPEESSELLLERLRQEALTRIENTRRTVNKRIGLDLKFYSKAMNFTLLTEQNGKWYKNKSPLLVEFYQICDEPQAFAGTETISEINLSAPIFSFDEFMLYKKEILKVQEEKSLTRIEGLAGRNFLEDFTSEAGKILYSYWSTPPLGFDYPEYISGVGSFTFSPIKGIF